MGSEVFGAFLWTWSLNWITFIRLSVSCLGLERNPECWKELRFQMSKIFKQDLIDDPVAVFELPLTLILRHLP